MDPLSHVVIGRALTASVTDEARWFGRGAGAAAILGALSPDVDGLLVAFGWDIYLRAHEIGTHSIAGAVVVACASAAIVRAFARGSRYLPLAAAAIVGAMSHLALDVLSGARIRLAWPLADRRVCIPLMSMADPWFVAICAAGLYAWARGRTRGRSWGRTWGRTWGRGQGRSRGRRWGRSRGRSRGRTLAQPFAPRFRARAVLVAAGLFLAVKGVLLARTLRVSTVPIASLTAMQAHWGSFTRWTAFERTPTLLRTWTVTATGSRPVLTLAVPLDPEPAIVTRSASLDTVRNFRRTHDFEFPVERPSNGLTAVWWSDLRYCWRSDAGPVTCALWFGGLFGSDGRAVSQQVKIGGWTQTRPAPR